jgi:hypothetical protein
VGSNIEVKNATAVMGQHQEHVKNLETDGGDRKEIDGDQFRTGLCPAPQSLLKGVLITALILHALIVGTSSSIERALSGCRNCSENNDREH